MFLLLYYLLIRDFVRGACFHLVVLLLLATVVYVRTYVYGGMAISLCVLANNKEAEES